MKLAISRFYKNLSMFVLAAGVAGPSWSDIYVGQVAPMTSPIAVEGKQANIGIKIAIDSANQQANPGQKIVLRTEDDEYDPVKTVALVRKLAKSDTLALMAIVGSPSMAKILTEQVPETTGMPIIGVLPGAEPLRSPLNSHVFHVRAGDNEQFRMLVRNALTIGLNKMAVVYLDTASVKAGVATLEKVLKEASLTPVVMIPIPPKANGDYRATVKALQNANPNLIVMALPGQIAGEFVKAYREEGTGAQITSLSYGDPEALCRVASPDKARGISIAGVMPNIRNTVLPLVKQFHEDFRAYGPKDAKPNPMQFEGYVSARVLLEGIKRISGNPTREKLVVALNSMHNVNLGGFIVDFSPAKHVASEYVEIGVLSKGCTIVY